MFRAISLSRKKLSNVECIWINLEHHLGDAAKVKKIRNINIRSQVKKRCTIFFPIITPLVAESRMTNKDVSFKVIQELWYYLNEKKWQIKTKSMKSHKSCHSHYAWRIECKHNQLWCQFGFFRKLKQKLYICSDSTELFVRSANLALMIAYLFIEGTSQNMSPVICEVFNQPCHQYTRESEVSRELTCAIYRNKLYLISSV